MIMGCHTVSRSSPSNRLIQLFNTTHLTNAVHLYDVITVNEHLVYAPGQIVIPRILPIIILHPPM